MFGIGVFSGNVLMTVSWCPLRASSRVTAVKTMLWLFAGTGNIPRILALWVAGNIAMRSVRTVGQIRIICWQNSNYSCFVILCYWTGFRSVMCDYFSQGYTWWRVATFEELSPVLIEHTNNSHTLNHGLFVIVLFIIRVIIFTRSGLSTMKYFNFYSFQKESAFLLLSSCAYLPSRLDSTQAISLSQRVFYWNFTPTSHPASRNLTDWRPNGLHTRTPT